MGITTYVISPEIMFTIKATTDAVHSSRSVTRGILIDCPFAARGIRGGCILCAVLVVASDAGITRVQSRHAIIVFTSARACRSRPC